LQLRRASDVSGKSDHNRSFLFQADALGAFAKFSLGGVGHELSISIQREN
jgi:hypothetical protein